MPVGVSGLHQRLELEQRALALWHAVVVENDPAKRQQIMLEFGAVTGEREDA